MNGPVVVRNLRLKTGIETEGPDTVGLVDFVFVQAEREGPGLLGGGGDIRVGSEVVVCERYTVLLVPVFGNKLILLCTAVIKPLYRVGRHHRRSRYDAGEFGALVQRGMIAIHRQGDRHDLLIVRDLHIEVVGRSALHSALKHTALGVDRRQFRVRAERQVQRLRRLPLRVVHHCQLQRRHLRTRPIETHLRRQSIAPGQGHPRVQASASLQ